MLQRILSLIHRARAAFLNCTLDISEEPPFRCPCCGYAPCDCDDH